MHKIRSTFTVSDFIIDELNSVSQELNEKKSHIVEKALSMYFDALDEKLSDQRLKNLENKKEKLIPASEVFKELGL
ncbi:CopG family transcriptional regulator [Sulfurimonas crateris]|uniref:CopG family transcriptional regulator n=1 Tax=Sulfurimonas crateris TaxID=2574727 RepID=A0A4U2Z630_9BACT|nr:CopG family transcriptional regulator [Sulfurimonas crateris]TKI69649.1 CopG family transcriptional regulator [Sulfurimonas crateris]